MPSIVVKSAALAGPVRAGSIASLRTTSAFRRVVVGRPGRAAHPRRRRAVVAPRAAAQEGGKEEEAGKRDDDAAELTARDLQLASDLQKRIQQLESRPFYADAVEAIQKEGLSRRVLVGALVAVAVSGALIGGPSSGPSPASNKTAALPLSYYVAEVLACDLALQQARDYAADGEFLQYNTLRRRVADGATKKTLADIVVAAKLDARDADKARTIRTDFLELVDQMDYNKYVSKLTTTGDAYTNSLEEERKRDFSVRASVAARLKLQELIELLPQDEVEYALYGGANGSRGSTATKLSPGSL